MSMNAVKMKGIYIKVTPEMNRALSDLVDAKLYPSKNEAIRVAIRDLILTHREVNIKLRTLHFEEVIDTISEM